MNLEFEWEGLPTLTNLDDLEYSELVNYLDSHLDLSLEKNAVISNGLTPFIERYIEQGHISDNDISFDLNGKIYGSELHLNYSIISLKSIFN